MDYLQENSSLSLIECLPIDVVEVISGYLSVEDLAACCATSTRMREVFDCDTIWRVRCDRQLAGYLERTPYKVIPHFSVPDDSKGTLSTMSYWRQCFMRETHLWNNWRKGNYVEENLRSFTTKSIPLKVEFLSNDILILIFSHKIEFLNVNQNPHVKAANDIILSLPYRYTLIVAPEYDRLILLYRKLVLVYKVNLRLKATVLERVFIYDESEEITNIRRPEDINGIFLDRKRIPLHSRYRYVVISNELFLGVPWGGSCIHIWNYITGVKVKEDNSLLNGSRISAVKNSKSFLFLLVVSGDNRFYNLLAYDIATLSYSSFNLNLEEFCSFDVTDDFIAVWYSSVCAINDDGMCLEVYDRKTCQVVLANQIIHTNCKTINNNFIFIQNNELKVFCPYDHSFQCLHLTPQFHADLRIINNRYILIYLSDFTWHMCDYNRLNNKNTFTVYGDILNYPRINKSSTRIVDASMVLRTLW